jgi:hypothetical protein
MECSGSQEVPAGSYIVPDISDLYFASVSSKSILIVSSILPSSQNHFFYDLPTNISYAFLNLMRSEGLPLLSSLNFSS